MLLFSVVCILTFTGNALASPGNSTVKAKHHHRHTSSATEDICVIGPDGKQYCGELPPSPAPDEGGGPTEPQDEPESPVSSDGGDSEPGKPRSTAAPVPKPKPKPKPKPVVVPKPPPPPPSICRNMYVAALKDLPSRTFRDDKTGDCSYQDPSVNVLLDERTDKLVYRVGDEITFTEKVVNLDSSEAPDVHLQKALPPGMVLVPRLRNVDWDYIDPNSGNHSPDLCHVEGGVGAQLVDCRFPLINSGEQWTVTIHVQVNRPGLFRSNTAPEGVNALFDPRRWNLAFAGTDKRADPEETANYGLSRVLVLGLIWEGKAYRTPNQLVPWLKAHHTTWKAFKRRHPGAVQLLTGR